MNISNRFNFDHSIKTKSILLKINLEKKITVISDYNEKQF